MGAVAETTGQIRWYSIFKGKISERLKKAMTEEEIGLLPKGVEYVVRDTEGSGPSRKVYELHYGAVVGSLVNLDIEPSNNTDFGDQIKLSFEDEDGTFVLSFGFDSGYGRYFLNKMQNIDLIDMSDIKVVPFSFIPKDSADGRTKTGLNIYQDGKKLDSVYNKENSQELGLPEIKKVQVGKNVVWDTTERDAFFKKRFNEIFGELSRKNNTSPSASSSHQEQISQGAGAPVSNAGTDAIHPDYDDDLPF